MPEPEDIAIDTDGLKQLIKTLLAEIISEAEEPFAPAHISTDYKETESGDQVNLFASGDFFTQVGEFIYSLDELLSYEDYELNTCSAYHIMGNLLTDAGESGYISWDEDWDEIADQFHERAEKYAGVHQPVDVPYVEFKPALLVNLLSSAIATWSPVAIFSVDAPPQMEELGIAGRLTKIRGFLNFLGHRGILNRNWAWHKTIMSDLEDLIDKYTPTATIPGGPQPWSGGGQ